MTHRRATSADCPLLAGLNLELIQDEGHRNPLTVPELADRMRAWLESGEYAAILFEERGEIVAYALYCERSDEVYLRQFFVTRHRRRLGHGRAALRTLLVDVWPAGKRLTVEVLAGNAPAIAFYRALGYVDYCLSLERLPVSVKAP